jgi:hypothetical protein
MLAWRDVAVRYKQTIIGVAWAVIRPLLTMVVFVAVFSKLADLPSDGTTPYALLVFAGMLPWFLCSSILSEASGSLITNASLVGKIYLPRIIIPASAAVVAVVDFAINVVLMLGLMLWFSFLPNLADRAATPLRNARGRCRTRASLTGRSSQRQVPGLPLCHTVHRPVRPVCFTRRLLERCGTGGLAAVVQSQSNGRSDRRFPVVPVRCAKPAVRARAGCEPRRLSLVLMARHSDLPPQRADLRRCDLIDGIIA